MSVRLTSSHGSWVLPEGETLLGRSTRCGICLLDARLSRCHAGFTVSGNRLTVSDHGSTNGVLVNNQPIVGKVEARHGDQVVAGPCLLSIHIDGAATPGAVTSFEPDPASERRRAEAPTAASRRPINSRIAAAVTRNDQATKAETDTLYPTTDYHLVLGKESLDKGEAESLLAPEERVAILDAAHELAPTIYFDEPEALDDQSDPAPAAPSGLRLAAGLLDVTQTSLLSLVVSTPIAVFGYALALRQAGAVLRDGLPILAYHGDAPASLAALAGSLLHHGGLGHAGQMIGQLQNHFERGPFITLYLAVTLSLLVFLLTHLLSTVVATVLRGGPFWHRWLGLSIVQVSTNAPPSWGLAMRRWSLLLLLWPLAIIGVIRREDGLHDSWSGCAVRRPSAH